MDPEFFQYEQQKLPTDLRGGRPDASPAPGFTIEAVGSRKRFKGLAYSGGPLYLPNYPHPVVVDLTGLKASSQTLPTPKDHPPRREDDLAAAIGETDAVTIHPTDGVTVSGFLDLGKPDGLLVAAAAKGGLDWEMSIGAKAHSMEEVRAGETAEANGRTFTGPIFIARSATLYHVAFVRRGADVGKTHVAIAASLTTGKGTTMFEDWIKAQGFDGATLTPAAKVSLQKLYDAEQTRGQAGADIKAAMREARQSWEIDAMLVGHPEIRKEAFNADGELNAGWNKARVEKEIELVELRAGRQVGTYVASGAGKPGSFEVMACALAQAGKLENHEKMFSDEVLQAAHTTYKGRIGLQELLLNAAYVNGYRGGVSAAKTDLPGVLKAAFSSLSLPGILSNNVNKFLLQGFMAVEQTWRSIAKVRPVSDFKAITSYRMNGAFEFEEVGPTGELKHGEVSEESFTNQARTYGKMFAVTRQDIINDDLGAMTDLPRRIGRGSALKFNKVFWAAFVDNSAFFTDPSQHFYKGADSVLGSAGLAKVLAKFRAKTDDESAPLAIEPKILLTPSALEVTAMELLQSTNYNTGGSSTSDKVPNKSIWANRFTHVQSAYLDANSATAWYLLADPMDVAVIEACFLNGVETPTVEQADADFRVLGIEMRGYFDFGATKQDARGGVKSKGAA